VTVFLGSATALLTLLEESCSPVERIDSLDLSKTVLLAISVHSQKGMEEVKTCLAYGLRIWTLHLSVDEDLDELLAGWRIHGLRKLALSSDFTESWFRKFVQGHPLLKTINLHNNQFEFQDGPIIPLLDTFIQQIRKEELDDTVSFRQLTLTRANLGATPDSNVETFGEWCVTELFLDPFKWSSGRVLQLAQSSCPQISTLTIEPTKDIVIPFDELVTLLSSFASLRVFNLTGKFNVLDLGNHVFPNSQMKTAIIWYTSRIALRVPTIEVFFIKLAKDRNEPKKRWWYFEGRLEVKDSGIEGRHTVLSAFS